MKKIIFLLMLLFSVTIFAEKLTTDGKNNLDKLIGNWYAPDYTILKKGNRYFMELPTDSFIDEPLIITNYKNGAMKVKTGNNEYLYFAYDTKYKRLVILDYNLNIKSYFTREFIKNVN